MILFDLEKNNSSLDYKHYRCRIENKIFNSPSIINKPIETPIQKGKITCPSCDSTDIENFNPESQKCIKCGEGNYGIVKWF